jgi:hypothetical protein
LPRLKTPALRPWCLKVSVVSGNLDRVKPPKPGLRDFVRSSRHRLLAFRHLLKLSQMHVRGTRLWWRVRRSVDFPSTSNHGAILLISAVSRPKPHSSARKRRSCLLLKSVIGTESSAYRIQPMPKSPPHVHQSTESTPAISIEARLGSGHASGSRHQQIIHRQYHRSTRLACLLRTLLVRLLICLLERLLLPLLLLLLSR